MGGSFSCSFLLIKFNVMEARLNLMKENEARNEPREKSKGKVKKEKQSVRHSFFFSYLCFTHFLCL